MQRHTTSIIVWKLFAGVLAVAGLAKTVDSNVIVRSVPEQETVVADGQTEYRADVRIDTTGVPDKKISNGGWQVYLPDESTFTRSQLPDPQNNPSQVEDDFFFEFFMDPSYNFIDNTLEEVGPTGWRKALRSNHRLVDYSPNSPSNREGSLGQYFFTVNPGTSGIEKWFRLNGISIYATDGTRYGLSNDNLTVENQKFKIVEPCWADRTGPNGKPDGKVDSYDREQFENCFSGAAIPYNAGCEWADVNGDGAVDMQDFGVFQRNIGRGENDDWSCQTYSN